ncbi:MAG: GC-type dockerin domain-anchored protein [Phycisphaerales bacterium]
MLKIGQKVVRASVLVASVVASAGVARADRDGLEPTSTLEALLRAGERRATQRGEDPAAARERLFGQIENSTLCFVEFPTPAQLDAIAAMYDGLPPGLVMTRSLTDRYFTEPEIWSGEQAIGVPAQTVSIPPSGVRPASRIRLTYSFPADGVQWGADPMQVNDLNARLQAMFPTELDGNDHGRELIRQALAQWRRACAVTYFELTDNNAPLALGPAAPTTTQSIGHGDIRFGAFAQGTDSGVLAYNYLPAQGGDMTINSTFFEQPPSGNYTNSTSNGFRYFRNAVSHEHGHGLGFLHSLPCNQTKLMEPFSSTAYDGPQIDELRGAQQNYGDRFAPNHTAAEAHDFGLLASDTGSFKRSLREQNLSTNGAGNPAGEDWFRFRLDRSEYARITVRPTGGVYVNGPQASMCVSDNLMTEQAQTAGDLALEVYNGADLTNPIGVLFSTGGPGVIEEIRFSPSTGDLNPGEYFIRVRDLGPNPNPLKPVQLYDLEIRLGDPGVIASQTPFAPIAVAGINKRVAVNTACQFIGDLNSRALEPGIALRTDQFEWDLDGDGLFEVSVNPDPSLMIPPTPTAPPTLLRQPRKTYTQNAVVPVTLRVTDDNGQRATDTILVVVTGDPVAVTAVDPGQGVRGTIVPVTIVGTNLGAVFLPQQVSIDGSGVTIVGQPVAINNGTQIVGLSFVIDASAPLGFRDVSVSDGTTTFTLVDAFEVVGVANPPVNDECVGAIAWPPMTERTAIHPFDNGDATRSTDQNFGSTPCAPGGMFADLWYRWVAPDTGNLTVRTSTLPQFSSRIAMYDTGSCAFVGEPTLMGCSIDGAGFTVPVEGGRAYIFRVGSSQIRTGGLGSVNLIFDPTVGACCNIFTGDCTRITPSACTGPGNDFQGLGTPCGSCPPPIAACCLPTGLCNTFNQSDCAAAGGVWQGVGQTCGSVVCPPPPTGACCVPSDGSCTPTTPFNCVGANIYQGDNTVCSPNPCPQPTGACCGADGSCALATMAGCTGDFQGINTACSPNPCPQPPTGACCQDGGDCTPTTQAACTGIYAGDNTTCSPNPCLPPPGACCDALTGACTPAANAAACSGGTFQGPGSMCTPNPCPQPTGACCISGDCNETTFQNCQNAGGVFNGFGSTCTASPCAPTRGACCLLGDRCNLLVASACTGAGGRFIGIGTSCTPGLCQQPAAGACCPAFGTCTVTTSAACTGTYQGDGTSCAPDPCTPSAGSCCIGTTCTVVEPSACIGGSFGGAGTVCGSPSCCQADLDVNGLTLQDLFNYLDLWFNMSPGAEFDPFPGVALGDLFAYLDAYFAGCGSPTTGSCCVGQACALATPAVCGGTFGGLGTVCASPDCCQADINGSGSVTAQDIFDYLTLWFDLDPRAEIDGLPGVTLQDLFSYLSLYFVGC